jgi:hypothetical protein
MTNTVRIEPNAVLDDGALYCLFGITETAAVKARRAGKLKYTRKGNRVLYLGKWVLAWLQSDVQEGVAHASASA